VVKAERVSPEGVTPLSSTQAAEAAALLAALSPEEFVAGSSVDWAGAKQLRLTLADGTLIDVQQVPDGAGRYHLRLASATDTGVRLARRYAFRVDAALP
jgi:hypothetical protein